MLPTRLVAVCGVEDLVGRDATVGHPLLPPQHPDDHVRHAVLGLDNNNNNKNRRTNAELWMSKATHHLEPLF